MKKTKKRGPQTVKSVFVVAAYRVKATVTPAVRNAASSTVFGSYEMAKALTSQASEMVKRPSKM